MRFLESWLGRSTVTCFAAGSLMLTGCATRGFVRNYVEEQVEPQRQAVSRVQQDLVTVRGVADSANVHSMAAEDMARHAKDDAEASRRLATKIASGDLHYAVVDSLAIQFAFNQATLTSQTASRLDGLAGVLEQHPRFILEISGYTDRIGTQRYNLRLGEERAETVRRYLNDTYHVPLARMATVSFGPARPVMGGEGREGQALNRRAEIRVLEVKDADIMALGGGGADSPH
jgi:peptidoglycan-associated lipoprotein